MNAVVGKTQFVYIDINPECERWLTDYVLSENITYSEAFNQAISALWNEKDPHRYDNLIERRDGICTEHEWIDLSHYAGMGDVCQHCRRRRDDMPVRPRPTGGGEVA